MPTDLRAALERLVEAVEQYSHPTHRGICGAFDGCPAEECEAATAAKAALTAPPAPLTCEDVYPGGQCPTCAKAPPAPMWGEVGGLEMGGPPKNRPAPPMSAPDWRADGKLECEHLSLSMLCDPCTRKAIDAAVAAERAKWVALFHWTDDGVPYYHTENGILQDIPPGLRRKILALRRPPEGGA